MENKYSIDTQDQIEELLKKIKIWKNLFSIKYDYFFEGWSITLREKNSYPRIIIMFHSYNDIMYSIRSFEIKGTLSKKEEYIELYSKENIESLEDLIKELKAIIYGKDLLTFVSNKLRNEF